MYCLFSCASELPESGREQGQTCQNPASKDVADHGQEILQVPGDSLFLGDFHSKSADLRRSIGPPHSLLELLTAGRCLRVFIPGVCANMALGILLSSKCCSFFWVCFSEGKQMVKTGLSREMVDSMVLYPCYRIYFAINTSNLYFYSNS